MRWLVWTILFTVGCMGDLRDRPQSVGGTGGTPSDGGEAGFLDVAEECPCTDLGAFEGVSVFTADDTPCPDGTIEGLTVHAEFVAPEPHTCSECTCPASTCALPQGTHTNAAKCPGEGSTSLPFGPAVLAEGACSSDGALPAGLDCDGVACVQSLTVPAMEVSCTPSIPVPSLPAFTWGRTLQECKRTAPDGCDGGQSCEPLAPEGALVCLYRHGVHPDCPAGYDHLVFHEDVNDTRSCDDCTCSPPVGAVCDGIFTVFSDAVCADTVAAVMMSLSEPGCVDILSGSALAGSEAAFVTQIAGTCDPGGGMPTGDVVPAAPVTLCCKAATVLR